MSTAKQPATVCRQLARSPHPDGDKSILCCPNCGSGEYLHNEDGNRCAFCGQCGQAIDWGKEQEADYEQGYFDPR